MTQIIKEIPNKFTVEYDKGSFDDWCVYLTTKKKARYAPKDGQYFSRLATLNVTHASNDIYNDFVIIYNQTKKNIEQKTLDDIDIIAAKYGNDKDEINAWFTIIYAGMIAEENKTNTKLGKRIKRLGMHQVLIDGLTPNEAANYSRGKGWKEIDAECKKRGF